MPKYILLIIICAVVSISTNAQADGKFFYTDSIPADLPYQRAAIYFENGTETLLVQSKYEATSENIEGLDIAWIVPVPNKPELIELHPDYKYLPMLWLSSFAKPRRIYISNIIIRIIAIPLILTILILYIKYLNKHKHNKTPYIWKRKLLYGVAVCLAIPFLFTIMLPTLAMAKGLDVDVLEARRVGVYDISVIKSDSAQAIIQWLDEHGFKYSEKDIAVFQKYVDDNWCFVTAKLHQDADPDEAVFASMASPLCLRFKTEQPVYPMALTASASQQTEVLLFVLADCKMDSSTAMETEFYGKEYTPRIYLPEDSPTDLLEFDSKTFNMTKLRGKFTPDQMTEDIYFSKAENQEPYRPTKVVW